MNLLLPVTHILDIRPFLKMPLFFLAGPILGGGDWQKMAAVMLNAAYAGDCIIVNPSRYNETHPLFSGQLGGDGSVFADQNAWERYYLKQAALVMPRGCIVFWLPCESTTQPRDDGDPYAGDTRGELGEWRGWFIGKFPQRIVIGAEKGFPRLRVIQRDFSQALGYDFPIYASLEETISAAIARAR